MMQTPDEKRQEVLKAVETAKKQKPQCRSGLDKISDKLCDDTFCDVRIKAFGDEFREWQFKSDEACKEMLDRVSQAVKSAVGDADLEDVLGRLNDWTDTKDNFNKFKEKYESGDFLEAIVNSQMKTEMLDLFDKTMDEVAAFVPMYEEAGGFFDYDDKNILDTLNIQRKAIANAEIPNSAAAYDSYKKMKQSLDKLRKGVSSGNKVDISEGMRILGDDVDDLISDATKGKLSKSRQLDKIKFTPYDATSRMEIREVNSKDLDELQAGVVMYKIQAQDDAEIERVFGKGWDIAGSSANDPANNPQIKAMQNRLTSLFSRYDNAKGAQRDSIYAQIKSLNSEIEIETAKLLKKSNEPTLAQKYAESYKEMGEYIQEFKGYFVLQPGKYKTTMNKYKDYLSTIEGYLNEVRGMDKVNGKRRPKVQINSIADLVDLFETAVANDDSDQILHIKTAIDVIKEEREKAAPRTDETEKETISEEELETMRKEQERQRKEADELLKKRAEERKNQDDEVREMKRRMGIAVDEPEAPSAQKESGDEETLNEVLDEIERLKNSDQ